MIITTTDAIEGRKIEKVFGLVKGNTVRARWLGKDIRAKLRAVVGGEMKYYTELLNSARDEAIGRMTKEAEKLGANAITGMRITTSEIMSGTAEILAYGTAVRVKG
jgi:uncharacterized protein YbjQ (UPF0145 family)